MNELQLRDRALEIARTTPGDLLENAQRIYEWLVQTSAVQVANTTFLPPDSAVLVPTTEVGGPPNVVVGERVVSAIVDNLANGAALGRR